MERVACVYKITNLANAKSYIGVSVQFNTRMLQHKNHPNKKMVSDINEFTWDSFKKEKLIIGAESYCYALEKLLVEILNPEYNSAKGGFIGGGIAGIHNPRCLLTSDEVLAIRNRYANGTLGSILVAEYGVSAGTISAVVRGERYKDIGGQISKNIKNVRTGENNYNSKLSDKKIEELRLEFAKNQKTKSDLAREYDISGAAIGKILSGEVRKDAGGPINIVGKSGTYKLNEQDIINIRVEYSTGNTTQPKLGLKYGVCKSNIGKIIKGINWKSVGGPIKGVDY